jgi:DNA-binding transcriptional MerR regulator
VDKAPDAYRTISEVAEELDLPQHVLRFWETRFAQIKPLKRGGGRRYYRPDDIDLLRGIRHLLYGEGYTIRGVQRIIKESGIKAIQALGRGEGSIPRPKPGGHDVIDPETDDDDDMHLVPDDDRHEPAPSPLTASTAPPRPVSSPLAVHVEDAPHLSERQEPTMQPVVQPPMSQPPRATMFREAPVELGTAALQPRPAVLPQAPAMPVADIVHPPVVAPPQPEPYRQPMPQPVAQPVPQPATPPVRYAEPLPSAARGSAAALAADHIRRLQAALYELSECRRRLDQAFETR